jgi:uncharacterized membrane protein YphA (DoxX/SURF4 family)
MSRDARTSIGRALLVIGRVALAIIFLYAGYAKMKPQGGMPWSVASAKTSLAMFAVGVDSYQLLSTGGVDFVAHWLPPFELFLGLWLLSGITLRYSALVTSLLLVGLLAVQIRSFALGQEISCGCFGPGERIGPWSLFRDVAFIAVAIAIAVGDFRILRRDGQAALAGPTPAPEQAK